MVARTENVERGTSTLCPVGFPRPYEAKATPRLSPALRQEIQGIEVVIHALAISLRRPGAEDLGWLDELTENPPMLPKLNRRQNTHRQSLSLWSGT